jgi:hypothetical protein
LTDPYRSSRAGPRTATVIAVSGVLLYGGLKLMVLRRERAKAKAKVLSIRADKLVPGLVIHMRTGKVAVQRVSPSHKGYDVLVVPHEKIKKRDGGMEWCTTSRILWFWPTDHLTCDEKMVPVLVASPARTGDGLREWREGEAA